jgi:hypothetical protein
MLKSREPDARRRADLSAVLKAKRFVPRTDEKI